MKMQNDFKSKARASLIIELDVTYSANMFDVSTVTLYYVFKVTPPFTDTSVKKRLWQGDCH